MRILAVDDEADTLSLVRDLLEADGHAVVTATSAAEALVRVQMDAFDLILLDVMMPGVDGHQLAQFLSNQWDTFEIPMVMITCRADRESHGWARLNGCAGYIEKPFAPSELINVVRRIGSEQIPRSPSGR